MRSSRVVRVRTLALCAAALALAGCGSDEQATPASAAQAPAPRAPQAPAATRAAAAAPAAQLPPEETPLEGLPMEALFAERPASIPAEVQDLMYRRDAAADGWASELLAQAAGERLAGLLAEHLRGARSDEGDPRAGLAGLALSYPGRAGSPPEVQVEVTSVARPREDRLSCRCRVALVRRPGPAQPGAPAEVEMLEPGEAWDRHLGPFQLTLELDATWEVSGSELELLELVAVESAGADLAPAASGALFADRTREAFGTRAGFEEEFLLPPEAYFFHSDRLTGYDVIGSQGMAVGDLDGDGWEDVFVCMPGGVPNRLYLRRPNGGTREMGLQYRVAYLDSTRSALILDFDGDGRRDLALAVAEKVIVHWGEEGTLSRPTVLTPASKQDVYGLSAGDFDLDGDLDVYACRYNESGVMNGAPTPYYDAFNGAPNILWRNDGGRSFSDVTAEVGLDQANTRFSFASVWNDLDDDGDLDLYVTNDFGRNHLWRNDGGHFRDVADAVGAEDMAAGMGASLGDVDSDGDLDLYVSNIYAAEGLRCTSQAELFLRGRPAQVLPHFWRHARGNTLLENQGDGTWVDRSVASGANRGGWAWGASLFDADNDGDLDIYSPNGFVTRPGQPEVDDLFWRFVIAQSPTDETPTREYLNAWYMIRYFAFERGEGWNGHEANVLLLGDGRGSFVDASGISGADVLEDGRCLVPLDWNRDGFLDLLVKNRDAPRLRLLINQGNTRGRRAWLLLELEGTALNRDAIGARVRVHTPQGSRIRTVLAGEGFLTQASNRLHFGLPDAQPITAIEVRWPDGLEQRFEGPIEAGRAWRLVRGAAAPQPMEWQTIESLSAGEVRPVEALPGICGRTVLSDKLPLAPLLLPAFDDSTRSVRDLAGSPILLTLWRSGDAASEGQLLRYARDLERIRASGLRLVPLALDSGAQLGAARRRCEALGLGQDAGYADGWTTQALEVLLLEVYHRTETNPVPTSLLIDRAGQLCIVYQGPLLVDRLLEDVAVLQKMDPRRGSCARLQGGYWAERPRRDLSMLAGVFRSLGYQEFAELYGGARVEEER